MMCTQVPAAVLPYGWTLFPPGRTPPRGCAPLKEVRSMADAGTGAATTAGRGLEGIVVAESELSLVDGTNGRLYYRGYSIHDLVQSASFEEVRHLLWYGELPTRAELDELNAKLVAARVLSPSVMEALRVLPRGGEPIDALRLHHGGRSVEHTSELQSSENIECRLLHKKKN